jgi:hypothetical protein
MKHVLSLGAGVQSSTLALMAAKGEVTPMPDLAIFADTQAEPESVYKWLDWLENELPFPVVRVTKGDLRAHVLEIKERKKDAAKYMRGSIPTYQLNDDGSKGVLFRKCTFDFKIAPMQKYLKQFKGEQITMWLGISTDESHRQKDSQVDAIAHRYPLIEIGFNRTACLDWMGRNGYPTPPRSSCYFCPYHNDAEWIRLKRDEPAEFEKAVQFEADLHETFDRQTVMKTKPFLHASLKPLHQIQFRHQDQPNLFGNECLGICGV